MSRSLNYASLVKNVVLGDIVDDLKSSFSDASDPRQESFKSMMDTVFRYNGWTNELVFNASKGIKRIAKEKIIHGLSFTEITNKHMDLLRDADKLNGACGLADMARDISNHYKSEVSNLFAQLVDTLIPNSKHLNDIIVIFTNKLNIPGIVNEQDREELLKLTKEIEEANKNIETNFGEQMDAFGKRITELALGVDAELKNLEDKLKVILQLPTNDGDSQKLSID